MSLFDNTMPRNDDGLKESFRKINQILDSGALGAITPVPYADATPAADDTPEQSAQKINQIVHVRGGI